MEQKIKKDCIAQCGQLFCLPVFWELSVQQPGLFSIYYDIDEDWLDMTLPDEETKRFVLKTIREIMTAHGKSLDEPEGA